MCGIFPSSSHHQGEAMVCLLFVFPPSHPWRGGRRLRSGLWLQSQSWDALTWEGEPLLPRVPWCLTPLSLVPVCLAGWPVTETLKWFAPHTESYMAWLHGWLYQTQQVIYSRICWSSASWTSCFLISYIFPPHRHCSCPTPFRNL